MLDQTINFFLVHAAIVLPLCVVLALMVSSTARAGAMAFLRLLARPLLLAAVVALVYDGTRTLAGGSGLVITPLGDHWSDLAPNSLAMLKIMLFTKVHPMAWDVAAVPVLKAPTWVVFGVLGMVLAWLGRRRKKVGIFIN